MVRLKTKAGFALSLFFSALAGGSGHAQQSFGGSPIRLYVASDVGGGYGIYAQMLAGPLGSHLPENPAVIVVSMPGAGGAKMANYLYSVAPKDGTALGVPLSPFVIAPFVTPGVDYDVTKFNYIGRLTDNVEVLSVRKDAPATTITEMRNTEIILGATGRSSDSFVMPMLMNDVLHTKIKIVPGYGGVANMVLAMERKEIDGFVSTYGAQAVQFPQLVDGSFAVQVSQFGVEKDRRIPDVPLLTDLVTDEEQKRLVEFIVSQTGVGRSVIAPPGISEARLTILRHAFDAATADPAFQADIANRRAELNPMPGKDLQALVNKIAKYPPSVIAAARKAFRALQ